MALIGPKSDRAIAWRPTVPLSITRGSGGSLIIIFVIRRIALECCLALTPCSNGIAATGLIAPFRLNNYFFPSPLRVCFGHSPGEASLECRLIVRWLSSPARTKHRGHVWLLLGWRGGEEERQG